MKLNETKKIGKRNYSFQFEGGSLFEVLMDAQKLSFNDVPVCGVCGKDNLILQARLAQDYEYTEIKCLECKATLTFGTKKDKSGTVFLRRNDNKELDWKKFETSGTTSIKQSATESTYDKMKNAEMKSEDIIGDDEIPF